jgi:hypothetical protein
MLVGPVSSASAVTGGSPWVTIETGPYPDTTSCLAAQAAYSNTTPFKRLGCFYITTDPNGPGWYYKIQISVPTLPAPPGNPIGNP